MELYLREGVSAALLPQNFPFFDFFRVTYPLFSSTCHCEPRLHRGVAISKIVLDDDGDCRVAEFTLSEVNVLLAMTTRGDEAPLKNSR